MVLPCGHNEMCVFRYRHKNKLIRYCLACLCEKNLKYTVEDQIKRMNDPSKAKVETKQEEIKQTV